MSVFVVSPAAMGAGTEGDYLPVIEKYHIAVVNRKDSIFERMKKGDLVIIAQGANWQKKVYFAGFVSASESYSCEKDNVECGFTKDLSSFCDLRNADIPFNTDCKWGESKNPHAVYELDQKKLADKKVIEAVMDIVQKNIGAKLVKDIAALLVDVKNLILTGAPGTGKTYLARQIAEMMVLGRIHDDEHPLSEEEKVKLSKQIGFCQFHPSYDYTDFVEGLRPVDGGDETIGFQRLDGIFKEFCKAALEKPNDKFVFIIDEINRGDIAKIFGELFFAIDPGYRGTKGRIETQYSNLIDDDDVFKRGFYVPENVYIIGTMNDIDRNVESMDFAIRRRFTWKEVEPDKNLSMWDNEKNGIPEYKDRAYTVMAAINKAIAETEGLGRQYQLGAAYFMKLRNYDGDFQKLWDWHIAPLLREYLRGTPESDKHFDDLQTIWNKSLRTQSDSGAEELEPPAQEHDNPNA